MKELWKAKLEFQKKIESIERSSTVEYETSKGRKKYDYVDLAAVLDYALPKLSECGLILSSKTLYKEVVNERKNGETLDRMYVKTVLGLSVTLTHAESGESESEELWHDENAPSIKDHGAMLTYLRRYATMTLLNLSAKGEDDDAGSGGQRKNNPPPQNQPPKQQQRPAPANPNEQKPIAKMTQAEIKAEFESYKFTPEQNELMRLANITSMRDAIEKRRQHDSNEAMTKTIGGEGAQ